MCAYIYIHVYHYEIICQQCMWQECESVLRCFPLRVALNDLGHDTAVGSSASNGGCCGSDVNPPTAQGKINQSAETLIQDWRSASGTWDRIVIMTTIITIMTDNSDDNNNNNNENNNSNN